MHPLFKLSVVLLLLASPAAAQDFVFDFEPPAYVPGPVSTQGWSALGTFDVVSGFSRAGVQSLRTTDVFGFATRDLVPDGGWHPAGNWKVRFSLYLDSTVPGGMQFSLGDGASTHWYVEAYTDGRVDIDNAGELHTRAFTPAQLVDQWLDVTVTGGGEGVPFVVHLKGTTLEHFEIFFASPTPGATSLQFRRGLVGTQQGAGALDEVYLELDEITPTTPTTWGRLKSRFR